MGFKNLEVFSGERKLRIDTLMGDINAPKHIDRVPKQIEMISENFWIADFGIFVERDR
jgi:hypothetical protein